MRSINKVILIGNVTRDPEVRTTGNGQLVATLTIATNRTWVTRDNRKMESAEYHDLVAWAHLAELCENFIRKGKLLYIEGYLKSRSWDTPEGTRRFKTEIVVDDLIMLDRQRSTTELSDSDPVSPNSQEPTEIPANELAGIGTDNSYGPDGNFDL